MLNIKTTFGFNKIFIYFILSLLILIPTQSWCTDFYIDPSAQNNGTGSFVNPYNTWLSVRFSAGNSYYQKCNTTVKLGLSLEIEGVTGSEQKPVLIGSYYMNGNIPVHTVSGKKPIINRNSVVGSALSIKNSKYLTIQNLDLRRGEQAVKISGSNYILIENCNIGAGSNKFGIRVAAAGPSRESGYGVIRNNEINSDIQIYGQRPPSAGGELHDGIAFVFNGHHFEIYGNTITDWGHSAIQLSGIENSYPIGCSYNRIYDNLIIDKNSPYNRGFGLSGKEGKCQHNKIYKNTIKNTTVRNQIGGNHNMFFLNIIDTVTVNSKNNISSQGIFLQAKPKFLVNHHNKIYNNVIYNTKNEGIYLYNNPGDDIPLITQNEIINNIIFETGSFGIAVFNRESIRENTFKNNSIYKKGINKVIKYYKNNFSVAEFNNSRNDRDIISDNIGVNPQLSDPVNGDFTLKLDSPCIDRAFNVNIKEDFLNTPVPQGIQSDIGAFERKVKVDTKVDLTPPTKLKIVNSDKLEIH